MTDTRPPTAATAGAPPALREHLTSPVTRAVLRIQNAIAANSVDSIQAELD